MKSLRVDGRLSFIVLLLSQLAATMGFTFVLPFMPIYVQELGVEDAGSAAAWAGVINSSTAVTMALAAPLWGRLGDRVGLKPMLLRATVAGSLVIGLMGLVGSPWQLLALKTLQGCLTGTVAAATVLVSATAPAKRAGARLAPSLLALFVVQLTIMSAAPALPGLLSTLLDEPVRVATLAGWVIATGAVAASVGSVVGGKLAGRYGPRRVIIWTLLLAG